MVGGEFLGVEFGFGVGSVRIKLVESVVIAVVLVVRVRGQECPRHIILW